MPAPCSNKSDHASIGHSYFAGSQAGAQQWYDYETTWLRQFFVSILLQPRAHWHDVGLYSRYVADLVGTDRRVSWFEVALKCGAIVPRLRDNCNSLRELPGVLEKTRTAMTVTQEEADSLGLIYADLQERGHCNVQKWTESGKRVDFGASFYRRVDKWTRCQTMPIRTELHGDNALYRHEAFWRFVLKEGREIFKCGAERTRSEHNTGVRMNDLCWATAVVLLNEKPDAPLLAGSLLPKLRERFGHDCLAEQYLRCLNAMYDANFASCAGIRHHGFDIDPALRTLTVGRPEAIAQQLAGRESVLAAFRLPTTQRLLRTPPSVLTTIRATDEAAHFFDELAAWSGVLCPSEEEGEYRVQRLATALHDYAGQIEKAVSVGASDREFERCKVLTRVAVGAGRGVVAHLFQGPALGATAGAAIGAAVGGAWGEAKAGAVVGAAVGGALGAATKGALDAATSEAGAHALTIASDDRDEWSMEAFVRTETEAVP